MAPRSNRRPGFSRRAQYGLFLGYVIAVAGVLFAVLLLIVAIIDPRGFAAVKGAALDATAPISAGGRSVVRFFTGSGEAIAAYVQAGSQNQRLERELRDARRQIIEAQAIRSENRRLRQVLGLAAATENEVAVARIVGSSFDSPRRLATLMAGASSGVRVGQPVRAPDGLIGRVLETGRWASRVLLITDGESNVPVQLPRTGRPALAVGRGDGSIELRTLEVGANPFRVGDILVTSGTGGIFPPNIPVARVTALDGDSAVAAPLADPARIDFALVLRMFSPAVNGSLDAAPPPAQPLPLPPAPVQPPPSQASPAVPRPQDPSYQPALQQPQPGIITTPTPQPLPPSREQPR